MKNPRLIYLKKSLISYGNELLGAHLLKEIIDVLCKWALGVPGLIYLKKSCISHANELLGIPRLTYLKKMLSVYGRRE
jgi:hypothetical protein